MSPSTPEPFTLASRGEHEPADIYARLVEREDLFMAQREFEPRVGFIMRNFELVEAGRHVLGAMHLPAVQGKLKTLFDWMLRRMFAGELPDFLMILDAEYWEGASPLEREILVFHEMCHMELKKNRDGDLVLDEMTGRPKWKIAGHDVEEFTAVVARYGAHSDDLRAFVDAANSFVAET